MTAGSLEGLVALVTGASGGIGSAIVARLAQEGANVFGADLAPAPGGERVEHLQLDVTDEAAWARVADEIKRSYGRLDILVHNAGVAVTRSLADSSPGEVRKMLQVNVEGLFLGTQALLPLLREGGRHRSDGAAMITMASVGSNVAGPLMTGYCTSKGAAKMFSKSCAIEFAALGYNIRCNAVCPGGVDTPMMRDICRGLADAGLAPSAEAAWEGTVAGHPLGRMARPDDIADAVVFLASDAARFVHGTELTVDGGMTAH